MIENVYVINLDKRPERFSSFVEQSKKSSFLKNYQRISGIDGELLDDNTIKSNVTKQAYQHIISNKKTNGLYLTRGAVGLALTYKQVLEQCDQTIFLLEDDIIVDNEFDSILQKTLVELPSDWDILYLGWYASKHLNVNSVSKNINELSGQINGTQGWIVNVKSAQKIISMFPLSYQIDTHLYRNRGLKKYSTIKPIITRCRLFNSDIQN